MGGLTVLLAGDFHQTLPVVPRGTRTDEVKASLKSSYLWPQINVVTLKINMRVHLKRQKAEEFSALLMSIGDGTFIQENRKINIPTNLCLIVNTLQSLLENVYPDLRNLHQNEVSWLRERAILTPKNDMTTTINHILLQELPSQTKTYQSVDSVVEVEDAVHYPVEFLNTLNPPGTPEHNLILKVGAPIILLRNSQPPKLRNGTRLQVTSLQNNLIEATIFTGSASGDTVFIPRIPVIPSNLPFQFKRVQFPVRLCFAMTINKSQGQTLQKVGIDLRQDCFTHGQLYVVCSTVSSAHSLVILQPEGRTDNVVYRDP
ncbi:PIF1 helicase, partial [Polypterus senegalus]